MKITIHYMNIEIKGNKFMITKTKCGKHWQDIVEFTTDLKYVNCKTCLKKIML
jgi:hypothetical protein